MPIVVDTSVLVASYRDEPGADVLKRCLASTDRALVSASCLVEASLLRRLGESFLSWLDRFLDDESFEIVPLDVEAARAAASAARLYGKGSGHAAQLNFGDCLSFGVAQARGLPLLIVGDDFARTPIQPAIVSRPA